MTKEDLRYAARQRREEFIKTTTSKELDILSRKQAAFFNHTFTLDNARIVAAYWPLPHESDPRPLMQHLIHRHKTICIPCIDHDLLVFVPWTLTTDLEPGPLGTKQPKLKSPTLLPDYVIIPLVAFDAHGTRLGQGKGFYDRTLQALAHKKHSFTTIGYAFDCQHVDFIPQDTQDYPLDYVITPTRLYDFRNGR